MRRAIGFGVLEMVLLHGVARAESDVQFWNELDIGTKLTDTVSITLLSVVRTSLERPNPQLGGVGVAADFHATRWLTVSAGFIYAGLPNTGPGYSVRLPLASVSLGRRFGRWSMLERSRGERLCGIPGSPYRFRQKAEVGYELTPRLRLYVSDEAFYQTGIDEWNQNRAQAGVSRRFGDALSLDLFYLQRNMRSQPKTSRVVGATAHISLGSVRRRRKPS